MATIKDCNNQQNKKQIGIKTAPKTSEKTRETSRVHFLVRKVRSFSQSKENYPKLPRWVFLNKNFTNFSRKFSTQNELFSELFENKKSSPNPNLISFYKLKEEKEKLEIVQNKQIKSEKCIKCSKLPQEDTFFDMFSTADNSNEESKEVARTDNAVRGDITNTNSSSSSSSNSSRDEEDVIDDIVEFILFEVQKKGLCISFDLRAIIAEIVEKNQFICMEKMKKCFESKNGDCELERYTCFLALKKFSY